MKTSFLENWNSRPSEVKVKFLLRPILLLFLFTINTDGINRWKLVPAINGTTTICMEIHPSGKVFLATIFDGVYVSSDSGSSWKLTFTYENAFGNNSIKDLEIDKDGKIYVLTQSTDALFVSVDEGNSWKRLNWPGGEDVKIFTLETDPNGNLYAGSNGKIYKSTNGGMVWSTLYEYTTQMPIWNIISVQNDIYATLNFIGVIIYRDNEKKWELREAPHGQYWAFSVINKNEFVISVDGLFNEEYNGVFKTSDSGATWKNVSSNTSSSYFSSFKIMNDGSLLAGAEYGKIYKSVDKGWSWRLLSFGKVTQSINSIEQIGYRVLAGARYGGVLVSDNQGLDWHFSNNEFPKIKTNAIAKFTNGDYLYGTYAGCFYYESRTGNFYSRSSLYNTSIPNVRASYVGTEVFDLQIDENDIAYMATYQGGIYKSSDFGKTWQWLNPNTSASGIKWIYKTKNSLLYLSLSEDTGLFQKYDNSLLWKQVHNSTELEKPVKDSFGNLFIANRFELFRSTDEGLTWIKINPPNSYISGFFINNGNKLFTYPVSGQYTSTDAGNTWQFEDKSLFENYFPPVNRRTDQYLVISNNHFITTTSLGIFDSYDGGRTWLQENDELSGKNISSFYTSLDGSKYAVVGMQLYEFMNFTTKADEKELPGLLQLHQNYPNPFNPETTINFTIPNVETTWRVATTTLKVYDALGGEVATLVNEVKAPGNYSVKFNGSNLPSGVYFCRLSTNNFSKTIKLSLVK